jgi:hypothetical protein
MVKQATVAKRPPKGRVGHPERLQDPLGEEAVERLAGDDLISLDLDLDRWLAHRCSSGKLARRSGGRP